MKFDRNSDVTKNVKIIEWMKKELILSVGDVFDLIFKGVKPLDEARQDTLANITTENSLEDKFFDLYLEVVGDK